MIPNIQILRSFAAVMVVAHHSISAVGHYASPVPDLEKIGMIGQSGVDLFFVISGFVMVVANEIAPKSPIQFFLGRLRRIVPTYWCLTLAFVTVALSVGKVPFYGEIGHTVASLFFVSQATTGIYPVLFLGWTLEYEMFYYVLFALGLTVPIKHSTFILPTIVISALSVVFPIAISFEFVAGMVVGYCYLANCGSRSMGAIALFLGIALLLHSINHPRPLEMRWLNWGLPAMLIIYGAVFTAQCQTHLLMFLGDASYSIYLVQAFVVTMTFKVMVSVLPNLPPLAQISASVLSTILIGSAMYLTFERPLQNVLRNRWR